MSGSTEVNPRESAQEWSKETEQKHRFTLCRHEGFILEAEDLHFHHNSAVFLPEFESDATELSAEHEHINGLAILAAAYAWVDEHADHKCIVVGHTDRSGEVSYNLKLSQQRADSVLAALTGDRDGWVSVGRAKGKTEDAQLMLQWIARTWGWACDPIKVDDLPGPMTKRATRSFQAAYNEFFDESIDVDGVIGKQTWGAFFDVFMKELAASIETDEDGLKEKQSAIKFVDDGAKAVGCGEHFPTTAVELSGYRSSADRRVEILFFEPKEKPQQGDYPQPGSCTPEETNIYNPVLYRYQPIPVEPVPTLVWIDLQTVDELGYRVKDFTLMLDPDYADPITITTDETGYWSDRVRVGGRIPVTLENGDPVRFGSAIDGQTGSGGSKETAVLVPRVAPRTIRDIVVPAVGDETLNEYRDLVRRYSRIEGEPGRSGRAGGTTNKPEGEPSGDISSRGGEAKKISRRTVGKAIADNLCIAVGWDTDKRWLELNDLVHDWLSDYHPTAHARGFFLQILIANHVLLYSDEKELIGVFEMDEGMVVHGKYGLYAPFEFFGARGNALFTDMATHTAMLVGGNQQELQDWIKEQEEKKDRAKDGDEGKNADDDADTDRPERGPQVDHISELIVPSKLDAYKDITGDFFAQRKIELVYNFPVEGNRYYLARTGGTGMLENYPQDSSIRERAHKRNQLVASHIADAYDAYINWYIKQIEKIPSDPTKVKPGDPHPEIQLYRLGPPDSGFQYPKPAGATIDEYGDILEAGSTTAGFRAWKAISSKLDAIWGKRSEGSVWIVIEFSAEAGTFAGPFSGATLKTNMEFSTQEDPGKGYMVKPGATREVPITVGGPPATLGSPVNAKYSVKKNKDTGREDTKVNFSLGKYGFEADSTGNVKMSAGVAESEWNQKTAEGGMGLNVSLRDLVAKGISKKKGLDDTPDWVGDLPNLTAKVGLYFRGVTEGTLLRVIANSPGFFEMRPRTEFRKLDWASLDWDEKAHLETLGWDMDSWDYKKLPDSAKTDFSDLPGEQKVAATKLPIPTSDPEWLKFWHSFSKN